MIAILSYVLNDRWGLGIDENDSDSLNIIAEVVYNRKHTILSCKLRSETYDLYDEVLTPAFTEFLDITGIKDLWLDRIDLKKVYDTFVSRNDLPYGLREKGWNKFLHSTSQT